MLGRRIGIRLQNRPRASIQVDRMALGVNTLFSETRLRKDEAKEATNMLLVEDGILDKRWGTAKYPSGMADFTNAIDGATEYRKTDGTRELIVVADGSAHRVSENGTKTALTGASFTIGKRCFFLQIKDNLYIGNGTDSLVRYNGTSLSTYSGLSTLTGVTLTRGAGLAAGNFTYYYRVSAVNEVGETLASAAVSITVNKERADWVAASNEKITVDWTAVTGAKKYVIYFADTAGFEVKLGESTTNQYVDDAKDTPNPYIEPPTADTTTGPKLTSMAISGNRIWGIDPNAPYRVYFTGTGVDLGNFAPAYGGGWVDLEKGGRTTTVGVVDFQGKIHVICETPDGRGAIWQVTFELVEVVGTKFVVPVPVKIIPAIGTKSARSIVVVENDVLFLNPYAVQVLGNEPGVLSGVLRTNELSAKIRPDIRSLNAGSFDKSAAYYFEAKVFLAVSTASGEPDRIMVFDRERGAWLPKAFTIGVSGFLEYTDSGGTTHFLGIKGKHLVEFSQNYQGDEGAAFTWRYISPRIPVSEKWWEQANILRAYFRLREASGSIDVSVSGTSADSLISTVASASITLGSSSSGIGFDRMGTFRLGTTGGTPRLFASQSLVKYLNIPQTKRLVRDLQATISGDSLADRAVILGWGAEGFASRVAKPLDWKL